MVRRVLLVLAVISTCSKVKAQKVTFDLLLNGKVIGKDEVTLKKLKPGLQVGSHYSYAVRGFDGRFDNEYRVDENYAWLQAAATNLNSNTHYLATLDKTRTSLIVTTMQNGEQSSQQLPVRPDLELLPTFDAAGAQLFLLRAVVHPTANNKYNVVVPSFGEPGGSRGGQGGTPGDAGTATADQLPSSRQSYDAAWTKGYRCARKACRESSDGA